MIPNRPFKITYYSEKDKKHITRNAIHDDGCRYDETKDGNDIFIYWDLDAQPNQNGNRWRNATNPSVRI